MKQALRIFIIYLIIIGLAYVMYRYLPFQFNPRQLNLTKQEHIITDQQDSAEIFSLLRLDSLKEDAPDTITTLPVKKDTVITASFLSCPSSFLHKLSRFIKRLSKTHRNKEVVRVLHFGDSQIEGDRITAYIREAFQERFGGSGPGLSCILDPQHINPSIWLNANDEWNLKSIYDRKRDKSRNTYGLMGQYADLPARTVGQLKISPSPWAGNHASNYQSVRLFIAPHHGQVLINGTIKNTEVINDTLAPSANLTEINWCFPKPSPSLSIHISSTSDIAVLGCALDSTSGIAIDNIALRGQSTPLLHRTDGNLFKAMGAHLNIGMIILQYGTNMIPVERSNYSFYKKILSRQFDLLNQYLPDIPVLYVGIADAAKSSDGRVESYKHLKTLRNAQKELALQYGFAYFDLFEAMGGEGSILEWTTSNPPLALTDYVHFSRKGGEKAASMITNALWQQFDSLNHQSDLICLKDSLTRWNN